MEDAKLTMIRLVWNTDVMVDVLNFLTRRELALQLAGVNRRFSTLCNCWCQEQKEEAKNNADAEAASVGDAPAAEVPASSTLDNGQQRKRKWNEGSTSKG